VASGGSRLSTLFCFGLGYTARVLATRLMAQGWRVAGTARSENNLQSIRDFGAEAALFDGNSPGPGVAGLLGQSTHVLVSIPPGGDGDAALRLHAQDLAETPGIEWIGYLSTVGVYGDRQGGWVDETSAPMPRGPRAKRRLEAERGWMAFGEKAEKPVHIFRLPGIYGPGRNALTALKSGKARRIVKPGQVFNRAHVADIANTLEASIRRPRAGGVYNVADNEPAPPQDVVAFAADLLGIEPPPETPFDEADLSPMGRSFYGECKRVKNELIKSELGVELSYPTYREGLRALAAELGG
jgi:nucleoside-diphosphate-sugar epimerase